MNDLCFPFCFSLSKQALLLFSSPPITHGRFVKFINNFFLSVLTVNDEFKTVGLTKEATLKCHYGKLMRIFQII